MHGTVVQAWKRDLKRETLTGAQHDEHVLYGTKAWAHDHSAGTGG